MFQFSKISPLIRKLKLNLLGHTFFSQLWPIDILAFITGFILSISGNECKLHKIVHSMYLMLRNGCINLNDKKIMRV